MNPSRRSLRLFVAAVAGGLFVLVTIVGSQDRFRRLIAEFEIGESSLTSLALSKVLPIVLLVMVLTTILKEWLPGNPRRKNVWNMTVICLDAVFLTVYIAGIFIPLLRLIEGLS